MKKTIKIILTLSLFVAVFASCKKDEDRIQYLGGTQPVLSVSSTADLVLTKANGQQHAVTFTWTNPEYQFTTGISSQDVTYYLQIDTVGSNFSTPDNTGDIVISKDLGIDLSDSVLNRSLALIGKSGLKVEQPHQIEFRIKATLGSGAGIIYSSNVIGPITITPYLDVAVPVPPTGQLFLVGSAAPGGWDNPIPLAHELEQTFTQLDIATYELTVHLTGGQEFLVIPDNGSWSNKYAVHDKTLSGLKSGGEFGYNGSNSFYNDNMPGPDDSGTYKLTFNFKNGRYTVVKL